MAPILPFTSLAPFEVFAIDATSAQIAWRNLGDGILTVISDGAMTELGDADRPGVAAVDGLDPATFHSLELLVNDRPVGNLAFETAQPLEGSTALKVATIGDLHLGETAFGVTRTMRERHDGADDYPIRCALAAVRESKDWGADLVVFKGDITDSGLPNQWELFDRVLDEVDVPVLALPGNHDAVGGKGSVGHKEARETRGLDSSDVIVHDTKAIRVLAVDSTISGSNRGSMVNRLDDLSIAIDTELPVLMFTHHHFVTTPVPYFWPPGIRSGESRSVLTDFAQINPNMIVSSGHTHRNRAKLVGPVLVTEVGSVKDHPGVWAGYEIHASGVRQTVRRLLDPRCVAWTDLTHTAVVGLWGKWSPGGIDHRSITHRWPVADRL